MFSLQLSVVVCWLAMVGLEAKPAPALPVGTYSISSQVGSNSIAQAQQPAVTTRTSSRGRVAAGGPTDYTRYLPAEDTPEVQEAKEKFFNAFKQQTDLISDVRDDGLWSVQPYADHYDNFEEAGEAEYDYEEYEEGDGEEEDDEDEEDEEDSDEKEEDEDDSSSSEEDSDEDEDSSSSSEEDYGDDSSSSSSSSSEEDGDPALLSMQALQALQPKQVEDTPEVEAAKKQFFDQYKAQLELVTNDI